MLTIDLKDKVAIITGSTQGIGLGIAKIFAKAGCNVAGCGTSDIDDEKAQKFRTTVKNEGTAVFYKTVDVRQENEINDFITDVVDQFGRVDYLISNAGVNRFSKPEECSSEFWDENGQLNLKSHWLISKACYPYLKEVKGAILLMTSNHAYSTLPDCFPYNVSKAGITGMVRALAVQWGPEVRVIGLAPGFIETEGGDRWFNSFPDPEKKRQEILNIHPTKRFGQVEDVGAFIAFLCSDYAAFINGTTYLMDGGRSAIMQDL